MDLWGECLISLLKWPQARRILSVVVRSYYCLYKRHTEHRAGKKKSAVHGNSKTDPPPSKRARRAAPKAEVKDPQVSNPADERGKLEVFMNLPTEMFSEVRLVYEYGL